LSETSRTSKVVNANYVFIQAFKLYQEAKETDKSNYIKALNLYKQVLATIDSIPNKFPDSDLALKIAQRKFRIGESTYKTIKKRIAKLRKKAVKQELLTILHDCALNLRDQDIKAEALGELGAHFWRNNQKVFALETFEKSLQAIEKIKNNNRKNIALNRLAVRYAELGHFEKALTLTIYFSDTLEQIRLLTDLGVAYYQHSVPVRARQLFNNAIELAEREKDEEKILAAKSWIALKLAEGGEFFRALEIGDTVTDANARGAIIQQIAEKLITSGNFSTIQEIIRFINEKQVRSELITSLVTRYSDESFFSQAREFAEMIEIPSSKARAYLTIAKNYQGEKLNNVAMQLIDKAIEITREESDMEKQIHLFCLAAEVSKAFHEEVRLSEYIKLAEQQINKISEKNRKSKFLSFLVSVCLKIGQSKLAIDICDKIPEPQTRYTAMVELCGHFAFLDNIKTAMSYSEKIEDDLKKVKAYFKIIQQNPANRNFKLKSDLMAKIIEKSKTLANDTDQILADCAMLVAKFEKFHQALQLLEHIKSNEIRNELICKLSDFKFKTDFFTEGIEILRLIQNNDIRINKLIDTGLKLLENKFERVSFKLEDFLPIAFSFWLEEKEAFEMELKD
jgi:tetratricopeptide (TPR) repeat protein